MEGNYLSAEALVAALRAGEVTSVELADEAIALIERDDPAINAICVPDFDRARAAARAADQARAGGDDRPLLGIPVTERLGDFRILVLDEHPLVATGSAVRAGVNRVADALVAAGARVQRHSLLLPDLAEAAMIYSQLVCASIGARFPVEAYEQLQTRAAALNADDRSLAAAGLSAMVCSHRDWIAANDHRELHRHDWRRFFAEFDAVVCPITPTPAFPHDDNPNREQRRIDIDGVACPYNNQVIWAGLATMPGLPATAIPACRSPEGLPVGVQLIGPMFEDRTTLRLAELLEQTIGGFDPPK